VLSANEDGVVSFFESGGLKVLAPQMSTFADGKYSHLDWILLTSS